MKGKDFSNQTVCKPRKFLKSPLVIPYWAQCTENLFKFIADGLCKTYPTSLRIMTRRTAFHEHLLCTQHFPIEDFTWFLSQPYAMQIVLFCFPHHRRGSREAERLVQVTLAGRRRPKWNLVLCSHALPSFHPTAKATITMFPSSPWKRALRQGQMGM